MGYNNNNEYYKFEKNDCFGYFIDCGFVYYPLTFRSFSWRAIFRRIVVILCVNFWSTNNLSRCCYDLELSNTTINE